MGSLTETSKPARHPGQGVVGSLSIFGNDVANLIELQAKLTAYDFEECRERIIRPLLAFVMGVLLVVGATPLILLGLADQLARFTSLTLGVSALVVGFGALSIAGAVAYLSVLAITRSTQSFRRSREEFVRNLAWLRTVVIHSGRS